MTVLGALGGLALTRVGGLTLGGLVHDDPRRPGADKGDDKEDNPKNDGAAQVQCSFLCYGIRAHQGRKDIVGQTIYRSRRTAHLSSTRGNNLVLCRVSDRIPIFVE